MIGRNYHPLRQTSADLERQRINAIPLRPIVLDVLKRFPNDTPDQLARQIEMEVRWAFTPQATEQAA